MSLWKPRLFAVVVCTAAAITVDAQGQEFRSTEIGRPAEKSADVTLGRYVFAGIGIDHYENEDLWKHLDNAVNDVDSIRSTLTEEFGFDSPDDWVLTDEQATRVSIEALVDDLGRNLQPDDNLVFFYAGHGAELPIEFDGEVVGRSGYLVPVGVKDPLESAESQYIEIKSLLEDIAKLPARHVLVILDSCYSGMALQSEFKSRGDGMTQQAVDLMSRRSRRVLTSAQADQLAADGGARFPDNSLFTGWLTEGLRRAAADSDEDGQPSPDADDNGLITVTELFSFVSGRVGGASDSRQTPDFGAFKFDNRGELVLALEVDPYDAAYNAAVTAFDELKHDVFESALEEALAITPEGPRSAYLRYVEVQFDEFMEHGDERERKARFVEVLEELTSFADQGQTLPMPRSLLRVELAKATRACVKVGCDVAGN